MTHAERKRQQRARLAAGQVHRVAVYLTVDEIQSLVFCQRYKETYEDTMRRLIRETDMRAVPFVAPQKWITAAELAKEYPDTRQTPPANP